MAKFMLTMAVLLIVASAMTAGAPAEGDHKEETHLRLRRAACNIPIVGGWINDSSCAGHCLNQGKAGGHCVDKVCECRKETLEEYWDQNFGKDSTLNLP